MTTDAASTLTTRPQTFMGKLGAMFNKLPFGWHKWPQAAQRVASVIVERARHCRLLPNGLFDRFAMSDPEIMRKIRDLEDEVGRRCVQKGLKQLEDIGVIRRFREGGIRFIAFLVSFAKPAKNESRPGRKSNGTRKPATEPTPSPDVCPTEKPADPAPTAELDEPTVDWRNWEKHIPPAAEKQSEEAAPRRRYGASLGAAVPMMHDPEKIRKAEENRQRQLALIAARKQAKQSPGQDQPSPAAESDTTARE